MKPCVACEKLYMDKLCEHLGHCAFEDSGERPEEPLQLEHIDLHKGVIIEAKVHELEACS